MTKPQMLDILILLSTLESWGFSNQQMFPDYLHERLADTMALLEKEVLNGKQ